MMCIDCDTEMTGNPVCRATRSAVRCRVPVSWVGVVESGIRWTPASTMRVASRSHRIAPAGRRELDVEVESAGAERLDGLVIPEHDERTGTTAENAFEPLAQICAR